MAGCKMHVLGLNSRISNYKVPEPVAASVGQTPHHFDIRYSEFDILLFKKESPLTFKRRPALSAPFRILPAPRITS
jgi:hypothetical protein